ncbi:MAG TPA: aldo/keto reductase [Dehalococcoidia bacterium]|nr:aldo/keto reductase [Dehalococcoidia bacterium]
MYYRKLGDTGSLVGEIGFGGWTLGGPDGLAPDDDTAVELIRSAITRGANFIDTADVYGDGRSERLIGRAIEGRREHAFIATKGGLVSQGGVLSRDFSPKHLRRAAEASRERLCCGTIDLYQLHHPTPTDLAEPVLWEELARLQADGVIRHVGVAVQAAEAARAALAAPASAPVATLQLPLNAFDAELLPLLPRARAAGIGVIARAPLLGGVLARDYRPGHRFAPGDPRAAWPAARLAAALAFARRFRELANENERSAAQAALGWVLAQEEVAVTIPGARLSQQLDENLAASDLPLPAPRLLAAVQHLRLVGSEVAAKG